MPATFTTRGSIFATCFIAEKYVVCGFSLENFREKSAENLFRADFLQEISRDNSAESLSSADFFLYKISAKLRGKWLTKEKTSNGSVLANKANYTQAAKHL
jgi:hypothetical protein